MMLVSTNQVVPFSTDPEEGRTISTPALFWNNITYKVLDGTKTILDDVSGLVMPGQLCAVMGPSGCGKTTLLDVLASRVDGSRAGRELTGSIDVKCGLKVRYVQQEDSLVGVLTVRESLLFAAKLADIPKSKVDSILKELGLNVCADVKVGTIFFKGISNGQKRRLSIGIELISSPSLLLLDEPTSGLDSASAVHVIQLLKKLSDDQNVTVVCTLHQPSHEIWKNLDVVSFMSSGKLMYWGATKHLKKFLAELNHPIPEECNIADYVLELINEDFKDIGVTTVDIDEMVAAYHKLSLDESLLLPLPRGIKATMKLEINQTIKTDRNLEHRATFWKRFQVLASRDTKEMLRDPGIIGVRLAMFAMLSILLALMFWDLGKGKKDEDITARASLNFYVAAFMVFMSVAVLPFYVMQRPIFVKERCNGAYDVTEYVLAKFIVSIPGIFLLSMVASTIVVLGAGLNGYGIYVLDLFLSLLEAEAFMALMAALVPHYIIGIALAAGVFGFSMLCEGFFKVKSEIPDYLIWGYHVSPHAYTFRVFMFNEFEPIKNLDSVLFQSGEDVLQFYNMRNVNMTSDLFVLLAFTVGVQLCYGFVLYKFHHGLR